MQIEPEEKTAGLYLDDQKYPSFFVNAVKGRTRSGSIALWMDTGTEGYF